MNDPTFETDYKPLFDSAADVLRRNYHPLKHSVGAAVLASSGNVYVGVNVESSGHGVCAESVAMGAAVSSGEKKFDAVVAVALRHDDFIVLSPCGNCRQMLLDYAPNADIIYTDDAGRVTRSKVKNLLPGAYIAPEFSGT